MRQLRIDAATAQSPGPVLQADLLPLAGHLGTSLGAVDAAGQVQEAVATDAFGQLRIPGSPANPGGATNAPAGGWQQSHLFAGEYWDQDAQLLYLRARWYDPQIGRFISADPFEGRQRDPRSFNRYGYAHGDPVRAVDPSGLIGIVSIGFGVIDASSLQTQRMILAGGQTYRAAAALRRLAQGSVKNLKALREAGTGIWKNSKGQGEEIHHLMEQRLWRDSPALKRLFRAADDMPGVVLKREEHAIYTQRWLAHFGRRNLATYNRNPSIDEVIEAAFEVYKDQPAMLNALLKALL